MIFTIIGIILRCLAYAIMWNSADEHPIFRGVMLIVYIILCVIGIIETYLGRYERPAISTILLFIVQIVASIYFLFAADLLVGKIIGCIVVFFIFGGIMNIFSDNSPNSGIDSQDTLDRFCETLDEFDKANREKIRQNQIEEERRENEEKEREKYVRDNWNSSLGRLNSDATMYTSSSGSWNKISKDGKSYEDDNGNWNHL